MKNNQQEESTIDSLPNKSNKLLASYRWLTNQNKQKLRVFVGFTILGFCISIFFAMSLSVNNNFSGELTVQEMSFTYTGNQPGKLFLHAVPKVTNIQSAGRVKNLTLTGKFSNRSDAKLNEKLKGINRLSISLPDETSQWSIQPESSQDSALEITGLHLQPNTSIEELTYNSYEKQRENKKDQKNNENTRISSIGLILKPKTLDNVNFDSSYLDLSLGDKPLKLILENYKISDLELANTLGLSDDNVIEFHFIPDNKKLTMILENNSNLFIEMSDLDKPAFEEIFYQQLEVRNVEFQTLKQTGNLNDNTIASTIINGQIMMLGREQKIEQNRFVAFDEPGIEKINYIKISEDTKPELKVGISGQTKRVQILASLDSPPIATLEALFIDKIFRNQNIVSFLSIFIPLFCSLVIWLYKASQNRK
jgi:hypothetical protein